MSFCGFFAAISSSTASTSTTSVDTAGAVTMGVTVGTTGAAAAASPRPKTWTSGFRRCSWSTSLLENVGLGPSGRIRPTSSYQRRGENSVKLPRNSAQSGRAFPGHLRASVPLRHLLTPTSCNRHDPSTGASHGSDQSAHPGYHRRSRWQCWRFSERRQEPWSAGKYDSRRNRWDRGRSTARRTALTGMLGNATAGNATASGLVGLLLPLIIGMLKKKAA